MMKRLALLFLAANLWALDLSPVGDPGGDCQRLDKGDYLICYDANWKEPRWVAEHLTARQLLRPAVSDRTNDFRPDPALKKGQRAELSDYRRSGYDRGHMAPAGDFRYSKQAMSLTFLLTNMAPQTPELNRGPWRELEIAVRALAAHQSDCWVFTGPMPAVIERTIGRVRIFVPQWFFKVVGCLEQAQWKEYGYLLPNDASPFDWQTGNVSVDEIEGGAGLDLFSALPAAVQARAEGRTDAMPKFTPLTADADQTESIRNQPRRSK